MDKFRILGIVILILFAINFVSADDGELRVEFVKNPTSTNFQLIDKPTLDDFSRLANPKKKEDFLRLDPNSQRSFFEDEISNLNGNKELFSGYLRETYLLDIGSFEGDIKSFNGFEIEGLAQRVNLPSLVDSGLTVNVDVSGNIYLTDLSNGFIDFDGEVILDSNGELLFKIPGNGRFNSDGAKKFTVEGTSGVVNVNIDGEVYTVTSNSPTFFEKSEDGFVSITNEFPLELLFADGKLVRTYGPKTISVLKVPKIDSIGDFFEKDNGIFSEDNYIIDIGEPRLTFAKGIDIEITEIRGVDTNSFYLGSSSVIGDDLVISEVEREGIISISDDAINMYGDIRYDKNGERFYSAKNGEIYNNVFSKGTEERPVFYGESKDDLQFQYLQQRRNEFDNSFVNDVEFIDGLDGEGRAIKFTLGPGLTSSIKEAELTKFFPPNILKGIEKGGIDVTVLSKGEDLIFELEDRSGSGRDLGEITLAPSDITGGSVRVSANPILASQLAGVYDVEFLKENFGDVPLVDIERTYARNAPFFESLKADGLNVDVGFSVDPETQTISIPLGLVGSRDFQNLLVVQDGFLNKNIKTFEGEYPLAVSLLINDELRGFRLDGKIVNYDTDRAIPVVSQVAEVIALANPIDLEKVTPTDIDGFQFSDGDDGGLCANDVSNRIVGDTITETAENIISFVPRSIVGIFINKCG